MPRESDHECDPERDDVHKPDLAHDSENEPEVENIHDSKTENEDG